MNPRDRKDPGRLLPVLLVEDSLDQAFLLSAFLRDDGRFDVTHVQDGERAVELLESRSFAVVITDINLPGQDGYAILRHVRERAPDTPVLAVTGYTEDVYLERALEAGAADVLRKPLDRDDVLRVMDDLLRDRDDGTGRTVLAVGARPGDVELGCGGTLAAHRARGDRVLMVVLDRHIEATDASEAARCSADRLGVKLVLAETAPGGGADNPAVFLRRLADEVQPDVVYVPFASDREGGRREAHRGVIEALPETSEVWQYVTETTKHDVRADEWSEVDAWLSSKNRALACYKDVGQVGAELMDRFLRAHAPLWGTASHLARVEPLGGGVVGARQDAVR